MAGFLKPPVVDAAQNRRTLLLAVVYAGVVAAWFFFAYEIRFDFAVPENYQEERIRLLPIVVGVKLVALVGTRQLGSMMTYFSVPDVLKLFWALGASTVILLIPRFWASANFFIPRGVLL